MRPSSLPRTVVSALAFFFLTFAGFAQEFRATITGRITDPTGAGVLNAKVTAQNLATNEQLTATASESGDYTIPFVKPGQYSVTAEAPGFKKTVEDRIELFVNDKRTVNLTMEVGQVTETLTVRDEAPLLDEATGSRGNVIENLRIVELPINGRNPFNLANLSTGVVFGGNPQFTRPFDNGDNVNFSINGGLRQTNEYLLDGAPDNAVTDSPADRTRSNQNIAYIPTVDTVQEFKIVTNFYDAQYGRTGGGIVNITTRSGANDFHGTGYEFLRRYQLDANTIQNNRSVSAQFPNGRPRYGVDPITGENLGGHKLDQYGTAITGPLWIPKVYNGRDKTFFMFGVENYVESTPAPILTSVPSALERKGDFSQSGITVYDPLSTRENPNFNASLPDSATNPRYIRDQFPNNVIPANRLNPVGLALANAFPAPNVGGATDRFNNFIASPNLSEDHFRNWIGRVDQNFGQKERMFFRYAHNRRNQFDNGANGFTGIGRDAQDPLVRINDNAVVDSVTILSPSLIANVRLSLTRFIQAAYRQSVQGFDATSVGFPASFSNARYNALPPRLDVEQYPTFGTRNPNSNITNVISLQPSVSYIRGKHSIKVGSDLRDIRANISGGSFLYGAGYFNFTRAFTQRLPAFAESTSGSAIASLLLGTPTSGTIQYVPQLAYKWHYYGLYFQDDIKLTSKLTVNLGLRWDTEAPPTERYNRQNRGFAFDQASPLAAAVRNASSANCPACANLTGGLLFAGTNGQAAQAFNRDLNNWQPRIGAAYALGRRTVIRGGYGMFYLPVANYGGAAGFAIDTPFISTVGGGAAGFTPANTLSNPFPNGLLNPSGASQGLSTFLGNNIIFSNPNREIPYVHQFSFGVQHQLPKEIKIDAAYVGSRSIGINTNDNQAGNARNLNVNTTEQLARARQDSNYFNEAVPNPFAGLLPNNPGLNGATVRRQQLLLPYPQFGQVLYALEPVGKLWYDSLQVNVEKRYSQGFVFVAAYTFSKNLEAVSFLNDQDARPTKTLTATDRPHRLVLSGVWQLPIGRGRAIGKDLNRAVNLLVGGWEYNFIATLQSGTPLNYPGNVDLIGNPNINNASFDNYFNPCVQQLDGTSRQPNAARTGFEPCTNPAWAIRGPNTLRTIPFRNGGQIRNPWAKQWDMSLNKSFFVTEKINAQFRFEAFNVFNTPILGGPNTTPTDPNFGFVVRNQSNFPRQIQLGIKANF